MIMSKLQLFCLDSICDDYENVQSISSRLSTDFDGLRRDDVYASMRKLTEGKFADCFVYDSSRQAFIPTQTSAMSDLELEKAWFLATDAGLKVLDEEWVD